VTGAYADAAEKLTAVALLCEAFPGGRIESPTCAEAAVELAVHGWAVFPTRDRDKPPRRSCPECRSEPRCRGPQHCGHELCHGVLDATTDVGRVVDWFTRFPNANVGARVPAGLVVLDIDPRRAGDEHLAELVAEHGPLPATLSVRTGSGGWHHYLRAGRPVTQARLPAGVELKTPRGYCVMPPSVHPATGLPYAWQRVAEPALMPGWLVELTSAPAPRTVQPARTAGTGLRIAPLGTSVADDFSARTSWADVLVPHGWRCLDADSDADGARWRHPTATSPVSATVRHGVLFCYSPTPGLLQVLALRQHVGGQQKIDLVVGLVAGAHDRVRAEPGQ